MARRPAAGGQDADLRLDPAILRRAEEAFESPFYIHLLRHPYGMIRSFEEAKLDEMFFRHPHPFGRRELAEAVTMPELKARHMALASARADPQTLDALDAAADEAAARARRPLRPNSWNLRSGSAVTSPNAESMRPNAGSMPGTPNEPSRSSSRRWTSCSRDRCGEPRWT